jgi:hypothetical protein
MNKAIKRDMENARIKSTDRKVSKKITEVHTLPAKPFVISDISQGPIVSDSFDGGFSTLPGGRYVFIKYTGGPYVDSKGGRSYITCDNTSPGLEQAFLVIDNGSGNFSFMASNGKYVSRQDTEGSPMICNRSTAMGWERFQFVDNGDDTFSLQGDNGKFVSSENGAAPMDCNRDTVGGWEKFTFELLPSDYKFDWLFNTPASAPSPSTPAQVTEAQLPTPAPAPVLPSTTAAPSDAATQPTQGTTATTQASMTGKAGKYWWLWYVVAIVVVIIYVKYYRK